MIREQKDQRGVRHFALLVRQIAMHVDQRFVEIVGARDVGIAPRSRTAIRDDCGEY